MGRDYAEFSDEWRAGLTESEAGTVRVFDNANAIGSMVAQARRSRGMRQVDLAAASGVQQSEISRIERGLMAPTAPTLLRLAAGLNARLVLELDPV